jgi:hypothetical protein
MNTPASSISATAFRLVAKVKVAERLVSTSLTAMLLQFDVYKSRWHKSAMLSEQKVSGFMSSQSLNVIKAPYRLLRSFLHLQARITRR